MAQGVFDLTALSNPTLRRIQAGLMSSPESAMLKTFGAEEAGGLYGDIVYFGSTETTVSEEDAFEVAIAIDDEASSNDTTLSTASFSIDRKFAHRVKIHAAKLLHVQNLTGQRIAEILLQKAMAYVSYKIDAAHKSLLTDTATYNGTKAAAAVWSDSSNATPFADWDSVFDELGGKNLRVWMGLDRARELGALPAFKQETAYFDAKDGRVPPAGVAAIMLNHYSDVLGSVTIDTETWGNTANVGQTASYARLFDNVVWAGYEDHIVFAELKSFRKARTWTDEASDIYYSEAVVYVDGTADEQKKGCTLTGT